MKLDDRESATVLAGLRLLQGRRQLPAEIEEIATNCGHPRPARSRRDRRAVRAHQLLIGEASVTTPYPFIRHRGRYMRVVFASPLGAAANLRVSLPGPLWIADIRTDPSAAPLWYANPDFYTGTFPIEIDEFDEDTGKPVKTHLVGDLAFAAGLKVMAEKFPRQFGQIMRDDTDAPCADLFLQCVCFGEEKYA